MVYECYEKYHLSISCWFLQLIKKACKIKFLALVKTLNSKNKIKRTRNCFRFSKLVFDYNFICNIQIDSLYCYQPSKKTEIEHTC